MRPGRKVTTQPFCVEVKNEWSYTSTPPYAFVSCTGTVCLLILPTVLRMSQLEEHDLKSDIWLRVGLFCGVQLSRKLENTSLRRILLPSPPVKQLACCNWQPYYSVRGCRSQEWGTCLTSFIIRAKKIQSFYRTTRTFAFQSTQD
jgi:hypothetical protein